MSIYELIVSAVPNLHLPIGHVVRTVLHAAKDAVELRRQHMSIYEVCIGGGSREKVGASTLDAEELPSFQCCATHLRELGHEAHQIWLGHHERGRGLDGVGRCG